MTPFGLVTRAISCKTFSLIFGGMSCKAKEAQETSKLLVQAADEGLGSTFPRTVPIAK